MPKTGPHPHVIQRMVKCIRDAGVTHFAYRGDREPAIGSLIDQACSILGRTSFRVKTDVVDPSPNLPIAPIEDDEPDAPTDVPRLPEPPSTVLAVPELTHPGESASNGLAERSVRTLEEQLKTLRTALEARLQNPVPAEHPVLCWMVEHAAYILNKYQPLPDGSTAVAKLHGN